MIIGQQADPGWAAGSSGPHGPLCLSQAAFGVAMLLCPGRKYSDRFGELSTRRTIGSNSDSGRAYFDLSKAGLSYSAMNSAVRS